MDRTKKWIAAGAGVVIVVAAGTGIAVAAVDDDNDDALHGSTLRRASAAALEHTGGGRVTETEHDDDDGDADEGSYQVEVTLDDSREVDVHLDRSFRVIDGLTQADRPDPDETAPLDAADVERIGQAALVDTPGGRVLDVDVDDDTGRYEVEVLDPAGTVFDVTLDQDLA